MRTIILLVVGCMASSVLADIDVPEEIQSPPNPIVAVVDAQIPDGAQSKGRWEIEGTGKASVIEVTDHKVHIWAEPGVYTVSYTGMWVDFENKEFDFIDEQSEITVTAGEDPGPDPPPGVKQLMMFYDSEALDDLPDERRRLLVSLEVRNKLEAAGHVVLEIVEESGLDDAPDRLRKWALAVLGKSMPRIAWAPKEGGRIETAELPASYDALVELLGGGK